MMLIATYFGRDEIRWASKEESTIGLIICILVIQLVAIIGAILTSKASAKSRASFNPGDHPAGDARGFTARAPRRHAVRMPSA